MTSQDVSPPWEFWIDVGGTFTDCIARSPDDRLLSSKVLSSGVTKGGPVEWVNESRLRDTSRTQEVDGFWNGYQIRLLDSLGQTLAISEVANSSRADGELVLSTAIDQSIRDAVRAYELSSDEEAPVVAIRRVLELPLKVEIPAIRLRLGTTRGTNALLTRTGARTAFVTTSGFADVLRIANQDRPNLFELNIVKPPPLFEQVVEIDERLDADGNVLCAPDPQRVREQFEQLQATGMQSIAICLLHSFANPVHEQIVEQIAREVGFEEISVSSRLASLIKIVSRGDTTVMDAYLNPILRQYISSLRGSLQRDASEQRSEIRLMTSAGGLVEADRFVGKDSVLSGPAGGVIGFSRVAQQAGFDHAIGFDMGGTSTDVSRFDGRYEYEFETQKAGIRVVAPMLAIETVAAGGGSVCGFDGVKLHVGPDSAGANPGPACYGAGGPLTVTDLNVYLGRVLPQFFPFQLDRDAIQRRLEELCEQIADSPLGRTYQAEQLAEGLLEIANANMVRAIRRISVAKGYDPADYVLVSFGGAGNQHACAMARALGMSQILIHPFAGILSAYGMGLADVRRFRETSVLKTLTPETLASLQQTCRQLADEARADVIAEGVPPEQIDAAIRSLEMRYLGAETTINVTWSDHESPQSTFARTHKQLYGYEHRDRAIEVTVARVEVVGRISEPPQVELECHTRTPEPDDWTTARFHGAAHRTAVFQRSSLAAGDRIDGPAIICEPISTIVVEPDFSAQLTARNEVLLEARSQSPVAAAAAPADPSQVDPVRLEIFNNLFASIAEQMGVTLQQTSFSTNVKERLDYSCAVFDAEGELVVNAPHIPVHLGAMGETVKRILADNPDMQPGDVFVTNDPYRGGSHLPDVTVVTPVHDQDSGQLQFFTASRAHHAEIGGIVPGSMPPFSTNLAEEGVLIRNFRLVRQGHSYEHELAQQLQNGPYPTRAVKDNLADVAAQVAANNCGVGLLLELVDRYGWSVVDAYMGFIQRAAAEKMRLALRNKPDGEYRRTEYLDNGAPIQVAIRIQGDQATVDFTGTGSVLPSNLNANRAITTAAVLYVFRCMIAENIPLNSGVLEPVEIVLPECLLNPPPHEDPSQCAAVVGGNVETSQRIVDTLLGALELAAASQGTMNNLTFGDDSFGYYETICGGSGATVDAAGADAVHTHMTNTRLTDVEVIERRYPVRIHEFSIRRDSGGAGHHRGGDGIVRRIEFLRPLHVSMLSQRREYAPFGLQGGCDGLPGRNAWRDRDGRQHDLPGCFARQFQPGECLLIRTPGGGGWGAP